MTRALTLPPSGRDMVSEALARDRLRARHIIGFILSAVAPLTVAAGIVTTAYAVTGLEVIPAAFAVIAVVLAVFAVGYVALARRITNAGVFYAFAAQGISKPVGVGTAAVAVVAYNLLEFGLFGAFGPQAHILAARHGVDAPWWAWSLLAWVAVAVLGRVWVDINGKVLSVLLAAEIVLTLVLTVLGAAHPAGGQVSLGGLNPVELWAPGVGAALAVAVLGFVGFENSSVYSEESKNPRRTVPAATYAALGAMAVLYVGASWAMAVYHGADRIADAARELGPGALFSMGGDRLATVGDVFFLTSVFAALLAFHHAANRYTFSLARERVLPGSWARTNRHGAPARASTVQSLAALAVIAVYAATGWDPMLRLFFWLGTTGGFGVLLLLAITSAAVLGYFHRHQGAETVWRRQVSPALALAALAGVVVLVVRNYPTLLGVAPGDRLGWVLPSIYPAVFVLGVAYGGWLLRRRPRVYEGIGLGANAATGRASTDAEQRPQSPTWTPAGPGLPGGWT